jgi:hypothetical protein
MPLAPRLLNVMLRHSCPHCGNTTERKGSFFNRATHYTCVLRKARAADEPGKTEAFHRLKAKQVALTRERPRLFGFPVEAGVQAGCAADLHGLRAPNDIARQLRSWRRMRRHCQV